MTAQPSAKQIRDSFELPTIWPAPKRALQPERKVA